MGHREVPQRDLPALIAHLEETGATNVRKSPADFDGMVEVRWDDSPMERQQLQAALRGWLQLTVITILGLILVGLIIVLISL